ncbi:MAG: SMP-30/gluconolactonase/LRE family protein [Anaerolineae bacterium]
MKKRLFRSRARALLLSLIILHPLSAAIAQLPSASDEVSLTAWSSGLAETGGQVTYTITLYNSRLEELADVAVTDRLPEGFTYLSGSTTVQANWQVISTADPTISGRDLTWGSFAVPSATYAYDNPYGIHTYVQDLCLDQYIDFQLDKALDLVGAGGHVKQLLYPVTNSTSDPRQCWVKFVNGAYDRDLGPVVRIQGEWGGSYWIKPQADAPGDYTSIAEAYKQVVQGLPRRDGHTLYVEVWNEPDLPVEWSWSPSAWEYGHFFVDVAAAIHSLGDSRIKVLNGGLTPGNSNFTRQLVSVPGFVHSFDLWATHCYPHNHPPEYNLHSGTARYTQFAIDSYLLELNVLARYGGRSNVQVILTETGHALDENTFGFEGYPPINESNRAAYMVRAFQNYWLSWPEVVAVTPFELVDPYETTGYMDWLYPTSDKPHPQYTAVEALPKPGPIVVPGTLVITFQARASDVPGTYYSDVSVTASQVVIASVNNTAEVRVVEKLHRAYLPLVTTSASPISPSTAATTGPASEVKPLSTWQPLTSSIMLSPSTGLRTGPSAEAAKVPQLADSIGVNVEPRGIAIDSLTQRAYVTTEGGLAIIDLEESKLVATVSLGADPQGVAVNPSTGHVYVALSDTAQQPCPEPVEGCREGSLSVVDGLEGQVVAVVIGLKRPRGVAVNPRTNRVYVTDTGADRLIVVDGTSNEMLVSLPVGSYPDAIAVDPQANRIYVANAGEGSLWILDGTNHELIGSVKVAEGPLLGMAVNQETGYVYIVHVLVPGRHGLTVIDSQRGEVVATLAGDYSYPLGAAYAVAADENTNRLYLAAEGELLVINGESHDLVAVIPTGAIAYNFGLAVDQATGRVCVADVRGAKILILGDAR